MASTTATRNKLAQRAQVPDRPGKTIYDLLEHQKTQIARALPRQLDAERFTRLVFTECRRTPRLLECTPESLLGAAMALAQVGLEPGPLGHAYLVPFRNRDRYEVTPIIGYRGMIDLARRSGEILSIEARQVCENDTFTYEFGLDPVLRHVPAEGDRGASTHFYGVAKFKDGGHYFEVLTVDDVNKFRDRSRASSDGPWVTDYAAMAKKTVIRRMFPFLPVDVEAAKAVVVDEAEIGDRMDFEDIAGDLVHAEAVTVDRDDDAPHPPPDGHDGDEETPEPESDEPSGDDPASPQQRGAITKVATQAGLIVGEGDDVDDRAFIAELKEFAGVDDTEKLTRTQAGEFIGHLQGLATVASGDSDGDGE